MALYSSVDELLKATQHSPHVGEWFEIAQSRIDAFARSTDDLQWIHVDPERSAVGPFGETIAHGYLTLSLLPRLLDGAVDVGGVAMRINYGLDGVRFTHVVPVGSRIRAESQVVRVERAPAGVRVEIEVVVAIEGVAKPALRARQILLLVEEPR